MRVARATWRRGGRQHRRSLSRWRLRPSGAIWICIRLRHPSGAPTRLSKIGAYQRKMPTSAAHLSACTGGGFSFWRCAAPN